MLYSLIKINDYEIIKPRSGKLSISYGDTYNEIKTEDGKSSIESVRVGQRSGSVSYDNLFSDDLKDFKDAIELVSDLDIYDPFTDTVDSARALISGIETTLIAHYEDIDVWSLKFDFKEL